MFSLNEHFHSNSLSTSTKVDRSHPQGGKFNLKGAVALLILKNFLFLIFFLGGDLRNNLSSYFFAENIA